MSDLGRAFTVATQLIWSLDAALISIVALSFRVSLTATVIALILGAQMGALLAISRFRGQRATIVLVNALLGLPPVVIGLVVYLFLSRSGPLGLLGLLFTPTAMVIAQVLLTTPIIVVFVHRVTAPLWLQYGEALQVDGASRLRISRELLSIGRLGVLTAFLAAFGRAIAEVGAIIIVGGNILGSTRTMTTAIALETSKGDLPLAVGLGLILISLSVLVSGVTLSLNRWTVRAGEDS